MDGNQSHDPLLGHLREHFERKANSSQYRVPQQQLAADAATPATTDVAIQAIALQAVNLRDMAGAGFMYWIVNSTTPGKLLDAESFRVYRDLLLEEAGSPSDPLERMLIEQLALAHFTIGRLHIRSCMVENAKLAVAFTDAATRLLGEFRRCTLALEDYRAKQIARKEPSAIVEVAEEPASATHNGSPQPSTNGSPQPSTNGKQQPSTNGKPQPSTNGKKSHRDTELASNGNGEVPQCLKKRMSYPTRNGSQPAAATAANGKA
jgi:hypothetical protein